MRSKGQAVYAPDNLGHFGLNLALYAHFTSPIRRYADLLVHRALIRALNLGKDGLTDKETARLGEIAAPLSSSSMTVVYGNQNHHTTITGTDNRYLQAADWQGFDKRRAGSRAKNKLRGRGIGSYLEVTGPPAKEYGGVRFEADGTITMLSGTLTVDEGCGAPLEEITAGQAFTEIPGKVHRAYNAGTEDVVLLWTEIYPPCYESTIGWVYVDGPRCEGNSGRSHLEKIEDCPDDAGK